MQYMFLACPDCVALGGGWSHMCEEHRRKIAPGLLARIDAAPTEEEKVKVVMDAINAYDGPLLKEADNGNIGGLSQ